jgi:uncharacterized HAD superfamily protein
MLICLYHNTYNIEIPLHDLFEHTLITINPGVDFNGDYYQDYYHFYNQKDTLEYHPYINPMCFKTNKKSMLKHLREQFKIKYETLTPQNDNDLTIHIRSGDIFTINPNGGYIMPPLSYYVNIIESGNYNDIFLVCEDKLNPCVNELLQLYPKIKFKVNDIIEDIKIIMSSKTVVCSYGTFVPALLNLTEYTTKMFVPSYYYDCIDKHLHRKIQIVSVELTEYQNKIQSWNNSDETHQYMISYGMDKFSEKSSVIKKQTTIKKTMEIINSKLLPIIYGNNKLKNIGAQTFTVKPTIEYTDTFNESQQKIIDTLLENKVKNVLEIGFNTGFSVVLMLLVNNNVNVTCTNMSKNNYSNDCYKALKSMFGDRIQYSEEDHLDLASEKNFDLIHIDGMENVFVSKK